MNCLISALQAGEIAGIVAAAVVLSVFLLFAASYIVFYGIFSKKKPASDDHKRNIIDRIVFGPRADELLSAISEAIRQIKSRENLRVSVTADDKIVLNGLYFPCANKTDVTVVCVHGFDSRGLRDHSINALGYLDSGFNVLIPDNRGHGESEGKWVGFGVRDSEDLLKWIEFILKRNRNEKIILHGVSMGAATVMQAARFKLPLNVRGIIEDCGFTSINDEFKYIMNKRFHLPCFPVLNIVGFYCKKILGFGFSDVNSAEVLSKTEIPVLFIHGDKDDFVPAYMSAECFEACSSEKQYLRFANAYHGGSSFEDPRRYLDAAVDFVNRYTSDKFD